MSVQSYTKSGSKSTSTTTLPKDIFNLDVKDHTLLKQAYDIYWGRKRSAMAVAKTRGLKRGGGRKPWKQKGTGRARAGTIRSPLWRGGGVTFGPTGFQNHRRSMSTATKQKTIRQALSVAVKSNKVSIIEGIEIKDGKSKEIAQLLKILDMQRRTLIVVANISQELDRAVRNIPDTEVKQANYLNVATILDADNLLLTKDSLDIIKNWLGVNK